MSRPLAILFAVVFGLNTALGFGRVGAPVCFGHGDPHHHHHHDGRFAGAGPRPHAVAHSHGHCAGSREAIHGCHTVVRRLHDCGAVCDDCVPHIHLFAGAPATTAPARDAVDAALAASPAPALTLPEPQAEQRLRAPRAGPPEHAACGLRLAVVRSTRLLI